jgi:WD40 repeat protein
VTGAPIAVLEGNQGPVTAAVFSPDGARIVTASWDNTARIWDAVTGAMTAIFRGHEDRVVAVAFSPDGRRIVTASYDTQARLWDTLPQCNALISLARQRLPESRADLTAAERTQYFLESAARSGHAGTYESLRQWLSSALPTAGEECP